MPTVSERGAEVDGEGAVGGLAEPLREPERGDAADHGQDPEADRERAAGEPALRDRVPVEVRAERPALHVLDDERVEQVPERGEDRARERGSAAS